MSHIRIIPPDEAEGALKAMYEEMLTPPNTKVPLVMQCMSLNPDGMAAVRGLSQTVTFGGSTLSRSQEEMIATTVSVINECDY